MFFGGAEAYNDKCHLKIAHREVHAAQLVVLWYLWWSEFLIVFDRCGHPNRIPHPRSYPLVIEPVIGSKHLTKVLMDGAE
jgi:hypothetical protein